ncbi:hypothetical protein [Agilicoccus flavus]|uniref:hypothetical protein n=1 Tax=Agilicoccus flavus TaxID=2775968 RepID=UPI001CF68CE0|nr:hypothetical protein [Agilicoccus flavus]
MTSPQRPRRPAYLPPSAMDAFAQERLDPAVITQVADESAAVLVRVGRSSDDPVLTARLIDLVDEIGLATLAEMWADRPARSLAGALWRLYVLREWVRRDPAGASHDYRDGVVHADVAGVVAGVADPPGPDELRRLVDDILRGIFTGDFAVALERAAAFCRVVAAGRGTDSAADADARADSADDAGRSGATGTPVPPGPNSLGLQGIWSDRARRGAALLTTADDLEATARAWRIDPLA